ncbi:MAG TPA: tetratricopeptide repeat protein [Pyrinomonadaceae bacterium]|nr:tetratricopeptide repeat protein [Pyrinomonadaceae bacterium]
MSQNNGHAQLLAEGQSFLAANEWQKAADAFARVLEANPSERAAVDGLVRALVRLKNFEKAEATLNQLLAAQPGDEGYLRYLAWVYDEGQQYVKTLDTYLKLNAADGVAHALYRLRSANIYEGIKPLLDKALMQFPDHRGVLCESATILVNGGEYLPAIEVADKLLARDAVNADGLCIKAISQRRLAQGGDAGKFDEAEKTVTAALAAHPDNERLHYERARIYLDQNKYEQAFEYAWQRKDAEMSGKLLTELRRRVGLQQVNPAEVERFFDESIKRFPQQLSLLVQQGWLYFEQKKYDLALASFIKSEDASSTESFISQIYGRTPAQDVEAMAAKAVAHFATHAGLRHAQADIFFKRKKYAEALEACNQTLAIEPEHLVALFTKCASLRMLGRTAADTSKFDEAERTFEEQLKKEVLKTPEDVRKLWIRSMNEERGHLHNERGQYREAFDRFIESENLSLLQSLFYWMGLKGFREEAERLLQTAERRFPENVEVLRAGAHFYYALRMIEKAAVYANAISEAAEDPAQKQAALFDKITLLRMQTRFSEAEALVREQLREDEKSHPLLNELGVIYYDQMQFGKALEQFRKVLRDGDEHNDFAMQWALASWRGLGRSGSPGKFEEAEEMLAKVLPLFPEHDGLLLERGWLYLDQNKLKEADEAFARAAALADDPRPAQIGRVEALLGLKRGDDAIKILDTLKGHYPNDTTVLERTGWYYMARHDLDNAKKEFESLLRLDPKSLLGLNGMAAIHFKKGEFENAEEKFRAVNAMAENNPAVQTNLAWALVRQGGEDKCEEAKSLCRLALQTDPYYPSANSCLGVIAFRLGNISESEDYLLASTRSRSREGGYSDLGALYVHMGRYEEADAVLKVALVNNPYDAQALIQRGYLYLAQDKPKEAVRELRRAAVVDKWGEESARMLATALMRAGEYGEAERVLRDALKRLDENRRWQLHLRLSELLIRLGDEKKDSQYYEDARVEAAIAKRLNNTDAEPYFHEGIALAKLKDYSGADINLGYCLALKEDHYDAQRNQRIVKTKIREQRVLNTGSAVGAIIVGSAALTQLVVVWVMYLKGKISETMLTAMIPFLLGLIVLSLLLRTLVKLKLPGGFEAEVSQTQQTESLSAGPQGGGQGVGFSLSSSPGGPQR